MDLPVPLGHVIANKYRVDSVIGSGGMGVVAAGYHLELDQPIAIKFLSVDKEVCAESAERFRREARTAARIHSEHAVKVFDSGVVGAGAPYMVMELLEGNDLGEELARHGSLPISLAAHYLLQAIDAIAEAHAMGVVHRDLKPGNLFLARGADGTRSIKVLDFGISKSVARSSDIVLTRTASMIGSPLYMSPEQMRSARDVDSRSDIWSLGAILYELVSGEPPFPADSIPELCVAVMHDPLRPVSVLVPTVPSSLDALLAQCMSRNLADRFATAADLADALVEFAPGSRRYAERARRLLSTPSVRASLLPDAHGVPPRHHGADASDYPTRLATTAGMDGRGRSRSGATQTSWGQTGRGAMSKRSIPFIVGGVLVLGVCGVLAWEAISPTGPGSVVSASASAEGNPTAAEIAALKPALGEAPPAPEPEKLEPATPEPPASAPEASAPARPAPPATQRQSLGVPRTSGVSGQRVQPGAPAAPVKPSSSKPGTITDFGGRRF